MIKNLSVNAAKKYRIEKKKVHELVACLRNELNFTINMFSINIVSSEDIHEINNRFLGHNYSTDIITFNYSGENSIFDGEIYISFDDLLENAKKFDVSSDNELMRLIIHGILHMLGYDDTTKEKKKVMKKLEDKLTIEYSSKFRRMVKK